MPAEIAVQQGGTQGGFITQGGRFAGYDFCLLKGKPLDDKDYQVPFAFTGRMGKITLSIVRPRLMREDEKKLMQTQRNNKVSE